MSMAGNEISATASVVSEQNSVAEMLPDDGSTKPQPPFSDEEAKRSLERSASTGKFWSEWENLKSILSYYLKQVLLQYPESKMTSEQQTSSLGETFADLVNRLDDAFRSFDDGPPFTLQRLCEILLSAQNLYPKLSKLAFALEKNLLVTSTMTVTADPHAPVTEQSSNGSCERGSPLATHTTSVENGIVSSVGDGDEIMAEAHETNVGQLSSTTENTVQSTEVNPTPKPDS